MKITFNYFNPKRKRGGSVNAVRPRLSFALKIAECNTAILIDLGVSEKINSEPRRCRILGYFFPFCLALSTGSDFSGN